jgi:hypothetical protein
LEIEQNFEEVLYDLRNLITHNYRAITNKTDELNEIVYLFETIIIELLITFNEKVNEPIAAEKLNIPIQGVIQQSTAAINEKVSFKKRIRKIWNFIIKSLLVQE